MKVLVVQPRIPFYGGAESVIVNLCKYMVDKGIETTLFTTSDIPKEMVHDLPWDMTTKVWKNPTGKKFGEVWQTLKGVRELAQDYDVISAHNFPATLVSSVTKKPIVWMCNEPPELFDDGSFRRGIVLWWNKRMIKKHVEDIVVTDAYNGKRVKETYGVTPHIIPYGIDFNFWSARLGDYNEKKNPTLLQVGTFNEYKNQWKSVEVFEEVRKNIPDLRLVFIGPDRTPQGEFLRGYAEEYIKEGSIQLWGLQSRETIRWWFNHADVLLHPVEKQGGWLTPFEAMCTGLPVVVSDEFPGAPIILDEGIGCTISWARIGASRTVLGMLKAPELSCVMGLRGKDWVRDNLSWEKFCEEMVKLLKKAAG